MTNGYERRNNFQIAIIVVCDYHFGVTDHWAYELKVKIKQWNSDNEEWNDLDL